MNVLASRYSICRLLLGLSCACSQAMAQAGVSNLLQRVRTVLANGSVTTRSPAASFNPGAGLNPRARITASYLTNAVSPLVLTNLDARQLVLAKADRQRQALQQLWQTTGGNLSVTLRPGVGTPIQIKGQPLERPPSGLVPMMVVDQGRQTAASFLRKNRTLLLLDDPDNELVVENDETDAQGNRHLRYRQLLQGLAVWPCKLSVHLDTGGFVYLLDGAFVPTPAPLAPAPTIDAATAQEVARASVEGGSSASVDAPELVVHALLNQPPRLAWKMSVSVGVSHSWLVFIDALSGKAIRILDQCPTENVVGSGVDLLGLARPLNVWQQGGQYYLIDSSKPMFNSTTGAGVIEIDDTRGTPIDQLFLNGQMQNLYYVVSGSPTSWMPGDAVSAAFNLSETFDYFLQHHARTSYDNRGGDMKAVVRIGGYANANWNNQLKYMLFGDADLYAASLDVIGHELTHAVTSESAQLVYADQPGALNEAFSDIFGEMIEARTVGNNDWLIGSAMHQPIRDMSNPERFNNPSKMSEFLVTDQDFGGVHENSGIVGHAYYLLCQGLAGAIGRIDAEKVFYQCLTRHLQPQSEFIDARLGSIASAEELFGAGSIQALKTAASFDAVEIFGAPATPDPTKIPPVQAPDSVLYLYRGFFDTVDSIWRRETALGDPVGGSKLISSAARSPMFVTGDGSAAVYVTSDNDMGVLATDGSTNTLLGSPGLVHSVAISPDARYMAFVVLDQSGFPINKIALVDTEGTNRVFDLVAPAIDGGAISNVVYADALDISYNGELLVYDALSEVKQADGATNAAWSIFGIDLTTGTTKVIVPPVDGFDIGNPSLSKTSARYLLCDARQRTSGNSLVISLDLETGESAAVSPVLGDYAYPCFNGDDTAVLFTAADSGASSGSSLYRQSLLADHLNPSGSPSVWISDAWRGVVYRRGTYVNSNAPPAVQLDAPWSGATVTYPASVTLQATASDPGGAVVKVEFYQEAQKVGESTSSPFAASWISPVPGTYRLFARAIDNLGASTDSAPVTFTVLQAVPLRITNLSLVTGNVLRFDALGSAGLTNAIEFSPDLLNWTVLTNLVNVTGTLQVQDAVKPGQGNHFYRVRQR